MNTTRAARWFSAILSTAVVTGALAALAPTSAQAADATVPACTAGVVAVSYHARDAAMGHRYGVIKIKNVSDASCRTGGYGGLSYVGDGDGTQIGAAADRTPAPVRSFVLKPGESLLSPVDAVVAQNYPKKRCHPAAVDGFRVYLPNETHSQFVAHPTTGCRNAKVHLLSHKPFRRPIG
jgi:hypothetical protein